jgi:hypothetical protein
MEKHYRVNEVANITGLAISTIRKRLLRRQIGYRKTERAIMIPASEVERLLGHYLPAVPTSARKG